VTYEAAVRSTTGQPARTLGIIEAELAAKVQAGTMLADWPINHATYWGWAADRTL